MANIIKRRIQKQNEYGNKGGKNTTEMKNRDQDRMNRLGSRDTPMGSKKSAPTPKRKVSGKRKPIK